MPEDEDQGFERWCTETF